MLMAGWLTLQRGLLKSWKRRFFVLTEEGVLCFYKDPQDKIPDGTITVSDIQAARAAGSSPLSFGFPFELVASALYVLVADTEEEMKLWVQAIGNAKIMAEHPSEQIRMELVPVQYTDKRRDSEYSGLREQQLESRKEQEQEAEQRRLQELDRKREQGRVRALEREQAREQERLAEEARIRELHRQHKEAQLKKEQQEKQRKEQEEKEKQLQMQQLEKEEEDQKINHQEQQNQIINQQEQRAEEEQTKLDEGAAAAAAAAEDDDDQVKPSQAVDTEILNDPPERPASGNFRQRNQQRRTMGRWLSLVAGTESDAAQGADSSDPFPVLSSPDSLALLLARLYEQQQQQQQQQSLPAELALQARDAASSSPGTTSFPVLLDLVARSLAAGPGLRLPTSVTETALLSRSSKAQEELVWALILLFEVHPPSPADPSVQALYDWASYYSLSVSSHAADSVDDFRDGVALCAVVAATDPMAITLSSLRPYAAADNFETAFAAAHSALHIPRLLDPADCSQDLDETSLLIYLAVMRRIIDS